MFTNDADGRKVTTIPYMTL